MNAKLFSLLISFAYIWIETCGCICFLDTFLEYRRDKKYRVLLLFVILFAISYLGYNNAPFKLVTAMAVLVLYTHVRYQASWGQCLFLALADYGAMYLCDFAMTLFISSYDTWDEAPYKLSFLVLVEKLIWLCVMLVMKWIHQKRKYRQELTNRIWLNFCAIPLITVFSLVILFQQWKKDSAANVAALGIAAVLVIINCIFIMMIQDIQETHRREKEQDAKNSSIRGQLAVYHDMQEVYDRQRRKMHDYKKQLTAIQTLLAGGWADEADKLLTRLNGSIEADMSVVNTNHHIVNAVLNQEITRAKQKGIPVMLKINDLQGIPLGEDEVVILLSNLMDNAVSACEKVLAAGGKPVIHLKLICEDGSLICSVKNPVVKKVTIVHNTVQTENVSGHGLGLLNVQELTDKYHGDMIVNCDEKEFSVVVML